jgi:tetratricopeptide (TPR) repeat protein
MRRVALSVLCLALVAAAACAPKVVTVPTVSAPRFPDFIPPVVPSDLADSAAAAGHARGWTFLQAGDLKNAEREFAAVIRATPAFYPAEIGLGYVQLADRDPKAALPHFDRALERQPADSSALVGRGEAQLALNQEAAALSAFEAAIAADPSLTQIAQRVEVLKFRGAEQRLADARGAARAGRLDDAVRAYTAAITSSPASAFLYRELAGVERQRGDPAAALAHFKTAIDLDPGDAASLTGLADLLAAGSDFDAAIKAYEDAIAIEPTPERAARLDAVRARAALARLPAEYRAIEQAPQLTRRDLAALIGVRLAPLLQPDRRVDAEPITDIRGDWAATWILAVARAGVMEPFANHAFQPRTLVRRIDLAQAIEPLLARIASSKPEAAKAWNAARTPFADLASGHLAYPAASAAIAAGVMSIAEDGNFDPSRAVTGAEAVAAIGRLEALAGLPSPPAAQQ